jgi:Zn-dependent peptidase ImmA (M78 family)
MVVRRKYIRTIVDQLLNKHRILKAPVPVEQIASSLGAEIRKETVDNNLCGFLFRDLKRNQAVIGINEGHHPNRQRFTVAHEIGHFLLHEGEKLYVDGADCGFQINRRNEDSKTGAKVTEREANFFAAELLMPYRFLEDDVIEVGTLDLLDEDILQEVLKPLADKYGVSTQALTFRLANLGFIEL